MADLLESVQKAMAGEEKWALLYMMVEYTDGAYQGMHGCIPAEGKTIKSVWPDVHGFYDTEAEARQIGASKIKPNGYFVRKMRNYTGSGI